MHGYGTPPGVPMMRPMDANKPKPSTTLYVGSLPESVSDDFVQVRDGAGVALAEGRMAPDSSCCCKQSLHFPIRSL